MPKENESKTTEKPVCATWDIALTCECPKCKEFVDLIEADDFWEDHIDLDCLEHGTDKTKDMTAYCPNCGGGIRVCTEY